MAGYSLNTKEQKILDEIPEVNDFTAVYHYTGRVAPDRDLVGLMNKLVGLSDDILSDWLNITTRTFRNYKNNSKIILKGTVREHIILILSLYKHGVEVFGSIQKFEAWLSMPNMMLDNRAPIHFLETISGLKFIDNRLTGMEYGENA